MTRPARILLNAATMLSFVLGLAMATLWVLSYRRVDSLALGTSPAGDWRAETKNGQFVLSLWSEWPAPDDLTWGWTHASSACGFGSRADFVSPSTRVDLVGDSPIFLRSWFFPLWLPTLLGTLLPAGRLASTRARRPTGNIHLCPICTYDLRATPDRCPECGTIPPR